VGGGEGGGGIMEETLLTCTAADFIDTWCTA